MTIMNDSSFAKRHTAAKVAFKKLPIVAVDPFDWVYTSSTPASWSKRLDAGAATIPVPRGAGIRRHMTEPTFPFPYHVAQREQHPSNLYEWRQRLFSAPAARSETQKVVCFPDL